MVFAHKCAWMARALAQRHRRHHHVHPVHMIVVEGSSPWPAAIKRVVAAWQAQLGDAEWKVHGVGASKKHDSDLAAAAPAVVSRVRKIRQHVNPLSRAHQQPTALHATWMQDAFVRPCDPVLVDIGCGFGTYALKLASAAGGCSQTSADAAEAEALGINVLGLEIRGKLVDLALSRKNTAELGNVHFLQCNANVDCGRIFQSVRDAGSSIAMVCIQFPDPHFKRKHHKRRTVNAELIEQIAFQLQPGTPLFVQSDVLDMATHMVATVSASTYFASAAGHDPDRLGTNPNPNGLETEREVQARLKSLPVYRMQFVRNTTPTASA